MSTALLDSLLAHIAIVDQEGIILDANEAWKSFNTKNGIIKRSDIGTNYFLDLQHAVELGNDYALKFILGMKKVLQGDDDSFSLTYPLQTENDTFWFKLTLRPCNKDKTQFIMIHEDVSSSVQANNQLKETQNRYQIQFEQSLDGIFITDSKGHIIDANPSASDILGWSREELLGRTDSELMDVDDPSYTDALQNRKETGTFKVEMNLIHKNGTKIPTEVSSRAFRSKEGKIHAILTFRDISRCKKIEQDLLKTKQFAETALESIPGAFFVLNDQGQFVRWNKNVVTRLGYTEEELADKDILDFVVEDYQQAAIEQFENCINGQELSIETKIYNKDGEIRDYFIGAKSFTEDGNKYVAGAALDMTEEKETERENRKNQLMLEQLFKNAPIGITIVDTDNNIKQINKSFENIFGYSQQEIIGENINELIIPAYKKDEAEHISAATHKGQNLQTESVRLTKDDRKVPVLIGGIPVKFQGEVIAIYGMYVDISEQAEYQQKIEHALREKEILLAELHHRVKNNLALINSLLELQLFDSDDPELKKNLSDVKKRIMTIASTHEVLYQNGNLNDIPFNKFVQELINSGTIHNEDQLKDVTINTDAEEFDLGIDQSIPCGLLLNELMSLIFTFPDTRKKTSLNIRLRQYGSKIHLVIEGNKIINKPEEVKNHQSLHSTLIEALVKQLDGQLIWPNNGKSYQKFEFIFEKKNSNGPARRLLDNS
jgi:PAS domain S-box-containing protein